MPVVNEEKRYCPYYYSLGVLGENLISMCVLCVLCFVLCVLCCVFMCCVLCVVCVCVCVYTLFFIRNLISVPSKSFLKKWAFELKKFLNFPFVNFGELVVPHFPECIQRSNQSNRDIPNDN